MRESDIERETNPEKLRTYAMLAIREIRRQRREILELRAMLHGEPLDSKLLELELRFLDEQLAARNRALFGSSSEKRARSDPPAKDEAKEKQGHGPRKQLSLPVVETVHELDEADRICPKCGDELVEIPGQFEEATEIDVIERTYRLVRHKRKKYRCKCGGCIETALGPPKLIPGGRYSINFAVDVAVAKYTDHLPLARQVKQMKRAGLESDSQTLWDQLVALEMHLEPTYEALRAAVLGAPVIGADETRWPMMGKGKSKLWWAWTLSAEDAVVYRILPSRSANAARELLEGYQGVVVCDGYGAYSALEKDLTRSRDGPGFELAHCWAHVRRQFVNAEVHYPEAAEALEKIAKLYQIEAEARGADVPDRLAHLAKLRREGSQTIVHELRAWMVEQRPLPRSAFGKAIAYTAGLWEGLCRFLDNPAVPLDNNTTERAIRGVAVGRKNHYGSRSLHGTRVAALFYTLIESAKLVGVDPARYLKEASRRAVEAPGTITLPRDLLG